MLVRYEFAQAKDPLPHGDPNGEIGTSCTTPIHRHLEKPRRDVATLKASASFQILFYGGIYDFSDDY